jgi:SPP1 family predicted phage head-tail adaptor
MNPGKLNKRILLQRCVETEDGFGGGATSWVDVAYAWASIEPLEGREYYQAQQINSAITHKVRIRYRDGITPDMRFVYNGRTFHIDSVVNEREERRFLVIRCQEKSE